MRFYEFTSRAYPHAPATELDPLVNLLAWFFPFDDGYARLPVPDAERIARQYQHLVAGTAGPSTPMQEIFLQAFTACGQSMSPAWRGRFNAHWHRDFQAHFEEVRQASIGCPGFEACMAVRRTTMSLEQFLDLAEKTGGHELPAHLAADPLMAAMRRAAGDVLIFVKSDSQELWVS